jgi:hypothetical protein
MTLALLIAGIVAVVAGLVAILLGIPVKEFSFGNTLILSGVVGVCTGMLLMGLHAVVLELKGIARRLGGAVASSEVRVRPVLPPGIATAGMPLPEAAPAPAMKFEPTPPPAPPPWQEDVAARERARTEAAPPDMPPPAASEPPRRRNLLFASTSRKEREREQARAVEGLSLQPQAQVQAEPAAPAAPEAPPASFDDAWPRPDRAQSAAARRPMPPLRSPSTFETAPPAPPSPAPAPEPEPAPAAEQPPVTVLKSGVVDGMAYSLYSDGSIEAQMPEGMMRFASIDELRAHLDQRS